MRTVHLLTIPLHSQKVIHHPRLWGAWLALLNPLRAALCLPPIPPLSVIYLDALLAAARDHGISEQALAPHQAGIHDTAQWQALVELIAQATVARALMGGVVPAGAPMGAEPRVMH